VTGHVQFLGVEPKLMQDGGVKVRDVVAVLDGVVAEFVGSAVGDSTFDSATGHPAGEKAGGWWSRPPVGPWTPGVRPNSVSQTTSVSPNRPLCLRSLSRPPMGWSTSEQVRPWSFFRWK